MMQSFAIRNQWPVFQPGLESRYFSSFDRTGGNDDGFTGTYSALYIDEKGEHVIFDSEGPGCLRTLWFTSESDGKAPLSLGQIRFYFDGEDEPRIALEANQLFSGCERPFVKPLVADNLASTGGFVSWVPIPYASSLKITTENRAFFYNAQYDSYPFDWPIETQADGHVDERLLNEFLGASVLGPLPDSRETSGTGEGVIERLVFVPGRPLSVNELRNAHIRIWWDGETEPSVDCPLGMFFGLGLGPAPMKSIAFGGDGSLLVNRFPMPFWQGFHIEIEGADGNLFIERSPQRYARQRSGHLCATYRKEHPTSIGKDYVMLDAHGAGKLVGTVLAVEPPTPLDKQWWEGDLRCSTNGKRTMNIHGTGHEDDHLGGWSNEFLGRPFTLPMHGEPYVEMLDRNGQYNGNCSLYRLWPGISFTGGISHSVEHGTQNLKNFNYSSVAFWYRNKCHRLVETDLVDATNPVSREEHRLSCQNESEPIELSSSFEGNQIDFVYTANHVCHLNAMEFELQIEPNNRGVMLRRTYDQFHGRQRARVLVDGEFVGYWYTPEENRFCRWAERDYFIPEAYSRGKNRLRITIDPPAGTPLWSVSTYAAWCVLEN